ncbi:hypothetical protein [Streptomyces sp. NBC_01794]|uniref:hypothetical protein n=1 Tax=Streptomyces sp. NBC_01794 TaxID=2975942 RepID=UPI003088FC37|nr:hypothetical protein OIE54_23550 [Streptomyces sp. NBC_01794]
MSQTRCPGGTGPPSTADTAGRLAGERVAAAGLLTGVAFNSSPQAAPIPALASERTTGPVDLKRT